MSIAVEVSIEQQALTTVDRAKAIVVTTVDLRGQAAEVGRAIAQLDKEAEEFFAPMKQAAAKAHKEICSKENSVRNPLQEAKRYLSLQIGGFDVRMEEERRAEEARLQREANELAAAEGARLAQEQAIQDAIVLEAAGDSKGAEAVLNHPAPVQVYAPPVILQKQVPKAEGVSGAKIWKFRITDETKIPREYLSVDEKKIGQVVRALKDKTNIPGIKIYPEGAARFRA